MRHPDADLPITRDIVAWIKANGRTSITNLACELDRDYTVVYRGCRRLIENGRLQQVVQGKASYVDVASDVDLERRRLVDIGAMNLVALYSNGDDVLTFSRSCQCGRKRTNPGRWSIGNRAWATCRKCGRVELRLMHL